MIILWPGFSCVCQWEEWKWTAFRGSRDIITKALVWLTSINQLTTTKNSAVFQADLWIRISSCYICCSVLYTKDKKNALCKSIFKSFWQPWQIVSAKYDTQDFWKNKYSAKNIILTLCKLSSRILSTGFPSSCPILVYVNLCSITGQVFLIIRNSVRHCCINM